MSSCEGRTSSIARAAQGQERSQAQPTARTPACAVRIGRCGAPGISFYFVSGHLDSTAGPGSGRVPCGGVARGRARVRCSGVRSRRDTRRTTRARRGRVRGWRPPWALCDHSTRTLITVCTGPRPRTAMARPRICRHCAHPHPCHHHSDRDAHNSELRGHAATAITRAQSHRSP